jgi:capsular exopolysaccharide synthesis family protein
MQTEAQSALKGQHSDSFATLKNAVKTQLAERRQQIQEEVAILEPVRARVGINHLTGRVGLLQELEKRINDEVTRLKAEINNVGNQSIDVEMMRGEIDQLDDVLRTIAREREQLRVELRSKPRVEVLQRAPPGVPANEAVRFALAALAALAAFAAPVGLILLQDVHIKKVNSSHDVTRLLGVEVIGSVPVIPGRAIRQPTDSARQRKRYQFWQSALSESVSKTAASLLRQADDSQLRAILVTSAVGREGKTTLATQLAMSLARAGRRTVLVDFDLRHPIIHSVYQLPLKPGICEALRGEIELSQTVQSTDTDNLGVVSAGQYDRATLQLLGHPATASRFKQLRDLGDFVIIDGCPVLPVADTGFLCSHVDGVVLAVRRDVSQLAQVQAAHEFLARCGIRVLGAVVTESNHAYYRDHHYLAHEAS